MHDFLIREIKNTDILKELELIGFDKSYVNKACDKFEYKNIKIYNLTPAQANILKQIALSFGADCATHRETITSKIEHTDCILGGSISQIKKIAQNLSHQPFGLKDLSEILISQCESHKKQTKIVGILNLTKDSFSDGFYNFEDAIEHLEEIKNADIIDIGAESTRPGFTTISDNEQLDKLLPIIDYIQDKSKISIDTRSSIVAEECLKHGIKIINDVSGFDNDENMPNVIAKYDAKIIIQHSQDISNNTNLIDEVYSHLKNKTDLAIEKGIKKENIIIDVGIGFGKTKEQNFKLINGIENFYSLGYPVMVGISRKSLLSLQNENNETKDLYTLAINSLLINKKVDFIRVHNVKMHQKLLEILNI